MTDYVIEAVKKARKFFHIEDFPGNFFDLLENQDYIKKYNLLLFKEDISKLTGFIGYGEKKISVICINYKTYQIMIKTVYIPVTGLNRRLILLRRNCFIRRNYFLRII